MTMQQPALFETSAYQIPKPEPSPAPTVEVTPKRKGPPPFMVHLTWQNGGPRVHQTEETEELAAATMRHWFQQFAGVRSIVIEDVEQGLKHIFTAAGYMFTVPAI